MEKPTRRDQANLKRLVRLLVGMPRVVGQLPGDSAIDFVVVHDARGPPFVQLEHYPERGHHKQLRVGVLRFGQERFESAKGERHG